MDKNINHHRSIFISDTHLLSKDSQSDVILDFLKNNESEYLYLVGDIFDLWYLRKDLFWPNSYSEIVQIIFSKASSGCKVIYVPGNHDEFFRKAEGLELGNISIKNIDFHTSLTGKKYLITHGDQCDAIVSKLKIITQCGGLAYSCLITMNRIINKLRRHRGLKYKSFSGMVKRKLKSVTSFIFQYEKSIVKHAQKYDVDGVICGHIHQPSSKIIDGIEYLNCGDFIENCSFISEDLEGNFKIIYLL